MSIFAPEGVVSVRVPSFAATLDTMTIPCIVSNSFRLTGVAFGSSTFLKRMPRSEAILRVAVSTSPPSATAIVIEVPASSPSPRVHSRVETPAPVLFRTATPSLPRLLNTRDFQSRRFASTSASLRMLATTLVESVIRWPDRSVSSRSFFFSNSLPANSCDPSVNSTMLYDVPVAGLPPSR